MHNSNLLLTRAEFELHRYCRYCGQRLKYVQYNVGLTMVMSKRCPMNEPDHHHDDIEYHQSFPSRKRNGKLTEGSRRIKRELAGI